MPNHWNTRRVDVAAGSEQVADGTPAGEVSIELLDADPDGRRLGFILQIPPGHTHAVNIAVGDRAASERFATRTLLPGGEMDTTGLPPALRASGRVTAWSGPAFTLTGDEDLDGHVLLNILEITE